MSLSYELPRNARLLKYNTFSTYQSTNYNQCRALLHYSWPNFKLYVSNITIKNMNVNSNIISKSLEIQMVAVILDNIKINKELSHLRNY